MTNKLWIASIAALAGLAAPAMAQDSVSTNPNGGNGLPGDALDPYNTSQQCARYILDLTPFQSCAGATFTIGPVLKSSKIDPMFFNSLISAQAISKTLLQNQPFAATSYSLWNMPGQGVNLAGAMPPNTPGQNVAPTGTANQFAVGFAEFGTTPSRINNTIGAVVNYKTSQPTRLYVDRVVAGVNQTTAAGGDYSQFGVGSVDSNGNLYWRADSFGSTGLPTTDRIGGNNVFRGKMLSRNCGALNLINNSGGSDASATDWVVVNSTTTHAVPNCVPAQATGGRPVYIGGAFGATGLPGPYKYESAALVVSTTTAQLSPLAVDQRGGVAFGAKVFNDASVGTAALLAKSAARATGATTGPTDTFAVFGVDNNGALTTVTQLVAPGSFIDNCDGTMITNNFAAQPDSGFDGYHSATAFRGGNGQIAVGRDQAGRGLAAAVLYNSFTTGSDNPCDDMIVCRFNPANPVASASWAVVAWQDCNTANGKQICNAGGSPIGELCTLLEVTGGVSPAPIGPSMSPPMFDSVGNVYFLSAVQLYNGVDDDLGMAGDVPDTYTTGLIRAVYDPATFCYRLDLMFRNRQVFAGQNSGRNYQLSFLTLAQSQTSPSLSPGAPFSGNIMANAWSGASAASLIPASPATLGGMVIQAQITYDVNGDGLYEDPTDTGVGSNPNSTDESYNALLFIGTTVVPPAPCPADLTGDGMVGAADLAQLLGSWGPCAGCPADLTGDGNVGAADLALLLGSWGPCP